MTECVPKNTAMGTPRFPTTSEVSEVIQEIRESGEIAHAARRMRPAGKQFAADFEKLLTDVQAALEEKAPNNELQKVVQNATELGAAATSGGVGAAQGLREPISAAADKGVETAKRVATLVTMIAKNPEFREDLTELLRIAQDVFVSNTGDVGEESVETAETATNTNPQQAATNISGTASSITSAATSKLAASGSIADASKAAIDEAAAAASRTTPAAISRVATELAQKTAKTVHEEGVGAGEAVKRVGEEVVGRVRETATNAELTDEQREKIVHRLQSLVQRIQSHPEVARAFRGLVDCYRDFARHAQRSIQCATEHGTATANNTLRASDVGKSKAELLVDNTKRLIENMANKSIDPLLNSLNHLVEKSYHDRKLREYVDDFVALLKEPAQEVAQTAASAGENDWQSTRRDSGHGIERVAENGKCQVGAVLDAGKEEVEKRPDQKLKDLVNNIREYVDENYQDELQTVIFEASSILQSIAGDRVTSEVVRDVKKITQSLFFDEAGRPRIQLGTLADAAKIFPILADRLAYVPIPRIEVIDANSFFVFDNVYLKCDGIVPDHVRVVSDVSVDKSCNGSPVATNKVRLELYRIHASCSNVAWLYRKRRGLFTWSDVGLLDLATKDDGLNMSIDLEILPTLPKQLATQCVGAETQEKRDGSYLHVLNVNVEVKGLNVTLRETRHDVLYKIFRPLINRKVKKTLEEAVHQALQDVVLFVDKQIERTFK